MSVFINILTQQTNLTKIYQGLSFWLILAIPSPNLVCTPFPAGCHWDPRHWGDRDEVLAIGNPFTCFTFFINCLTWIWPRSECWPARFIQIKKLNRNHSTLTVTMSSFLPAAKTNRWMDHTHNFSEEGEYSIVSTLVNETHSPYRCRSTWQLTSCL